MTKGNFCGRRLSQEIGVDGSITGSICRDGVLHCEPGPAFIEHFKDRSVYTAYFLCREAAPLQWSGRHSSAIRWISIRGVLHLVESGFLIPGPNRPWGFKSPSGHHNCEVPAGSSHSVCRDDRENKTREIIGVVPYRLLGRDDSYCRCDIAAGIWIAIEAREIAA
jgi:hypothetical protein